MIVIGTSGWDYPHWRGTFYPAGVTGLRRLGYLAERLESVELNGTFYSLKRPRSYEAWHAATPANFVFAVKGHRWLTHMKKLRDPEVPLANFLGSGVLALREKLGPLVWQLPPMLGYDAERLDRFLTALPRSQRGAAELAQQHDDKLRWDPWVAVADDRELRHAVEVRHASFADNREFLALLARHDVALVVAETAGRFPLIIADPGSFVYVRLHGAEALYSSDYTPDQLGAWAQRIHAWADTGKDVYVYFDNDAAGYAPRNAIAVRRLLGSSGAR